MTKEEHAKVLAALEAITKHFSISRLHESTLADTTVRGQAHEAIAIMRKEPEPQPCPNGEPCKHAGWCTEVYCQGIPVFRNQYKPEPISDAELKQMWIDAVCEAHTHDVAEAYEIFAAALLEKAR
jgi:hypothetical protein